MQYWPMPRMSWCTCLVPLVHPTRGYGPGRASYTKSPQGVKRRTPMLLERRPGQDSHPIVQNERRAMFRKQKQWKLTSLVACAG
jgi:hypothetical protein